MKKNVWYIIISVILLSVAMNIVDAVIVPTYLVKSVVKILLFLGCPLLYFVFNKDELSEFKKLFVPSKKALILPLCLGLGLLCLILGGYFLLKSCFDFSGIVANLAESEINAENFLLVSLYISFCNSFLEEFFFRGFAFMALKRHTSRIFAYIFSAFFFAFYHIGMTLTWLHPIVFVLEILGLMAGGVIFNFLNEKNKSVYPSWIVHIFCNFGINTIGFILFGLI